MVQAGDVLTRRYRLCERAGSGGMGDVWRAQDLILRRTVAVKVLRPGLYEQSTFLERFRREAQAIAALDDAGIVDVFDYGELDCAHEPVAYLVMPLVNGMPLSRRIAGWGNLSPESTMRIVAQVADSLQSAHDAGIIHRDVKPGNILLTPQEMTTLVDFGVARAQVNPALTATGIVVGTLTYMSPEQASGESLTPATDIYSLGAVAHECLTGEPPYTADTPLQVLSAHLQSKSAQLPDDVPEPIRMVIYRALQPFPQQRWPSAGAFASACRDAIAAPTIAHPVLPVPSIAAPATVTPPDQADAQSDTAEPEPKSQRHGWGARSLVVVAITAVLLLAAGWASSAWPTLDLTPVYGGLTQSSKPAEPTPSNPAPQLSDTDESVAQEEPTTPEPQHSGSGSATEPRPTDSTEETSTTPESVQMPDVIALPEPEASSKIEESGLTPNVSYHGEGEVVCNVIDQNPAAGEHVEKGATVTITVARATEECPV